MNLLFPQRSGGTVIDGTGAEGFVADFVELQGGTQ